MKGKINFVLGLFLGMAMMAGTGAAAAVVETVTAIRTTSPIYVDGERIQATAYNIGGSNYFRLRDLAALVDFGVEWDQTTRSVHIATDAGYVPEQPQPKPQTTSERYIPRVGDTITCNDGYVYEITDVSMYNNSMFATEDLSTLPAATCDWSLLPDPVMPSPEARHFSSGGKEYLYQRNSYETRRMLYTLYNAIGDNTQTWINGRPATRKDGSPLVDIQLSVPNELDVPAFWPWRSEVVTEYFNSCPPGLYCLEAWDVYCDGAYRRTEYYMTNI